MTTESIRDLARRLVNEADADFQIEAIDYAERDSRFEGGNLVRVVRVWFGGDYADYGIALSVLDGTGEVWGATPLHAEDGTAVTDEDGDVADALHAIARHAMRHAE